VVVASSNALVEQKATDHKRQRKFLIAPENGRNGEIRSAGENGREREPKQRHSSSEANTRAATAAAATTPDKMSPPSLGFMHYVYVH
jgi:hypothetical protein